MEKKLTRTGNSYAVVIDKPILEAAHIDAETPLEISTNGDVIVISPRRQKGRTAKIKKVVAALDRDYAGVFKRLAE